MKIPARPALLLPFLALPLAFRPGFAQTGPTLSITPSDTVAGRDFDLTLWSNAWNCGTVFDSAYATVYNTSVVLNYQTHQDPRVDCPIVPKAQGVKIRIPALKAAT